MSQQAEVLELKDRVATSYGVVVKRIRAALGGGLSIQNSREPGNSPTANHDDVVGLCGQGGRHPYFRIPLSALDDALRDVETALAGRTDPERALERISTACQTLRRATWFDERTGCRNDGVPQLVPLLPPEEIWCNGREMPLEVWRLLSFEYDLVAGALISQTLVTDPAFGSLSQRALEFSYVMGSLEGRVVGLDLRTDQMPAAWTTRIVAATTPGVAGARRLEVSAARLFFEAGRLLTPLAPMDVTRMYPALRYAHWLSSAPRDLRVDKRFREESIDTRYRGLFAEEIAIGMMAVVLGDVFGAPLIVNTAEAGLQPGAVLGNRTSGSVIADFVAKAGDVTIVAESKGSLGRVVSRERQVHAKAQVRETEVKLSGTTDALRLAFCSTVYFDDQARRTSCLVVDPPAAGDRHDRELSSLEAWRAAYASALRFSGLEVAARQVLRGDPADSLVPREQRRYEDRPRDETQRHREARRARRRTAALHLHGAEAVLDVGQAAVAIDAGVLRVLSEGLSAENVDVLEEVLEGRRRREHRTQHQSSFVTPMGIGCLFYSELDGDVGPASEPERGPDQALR